MQKSILILFALISFQVFPQTVFEFNQEKSISVNSQNVPIAFSQGINSAQIQTIDLNDDGVEEWVIWDINSRTLQVFEKNEGIFTLQPELSYFFPSDISGFFVLADFDGDGKKDLFTSTPLGIRAYRNTSKGSQISWTLAQNFLRLDGSGNIPVNNLDTPLLQDIDGDGDLDLVIFNFAQGDFLEFFRNTSVERKGTPDIDGFAFPVDFWGNFVFCGCDTMSFGVRCDGRPINSRLDANKNARIQHAGGHSILYRDFTGNGIPDLLIGRDECNTLYFLPNQGSSDSPLFTSFSNQVPGYGQLPVFPRYHVGQLIEEDLVISLNTNETSAPFRIDFANSIVKLEKSSGTVSPILHDQLFDLGENTRPLFAGNANLGSLLLTSNTKNNGSIRSEVTRVNYNEGVFQVIETDLYGLSALNLLDIQLIDYTSVDFTDSNGNYFVLANGTQIENGVLTQVIYRIQDGGIDEFLLSGLTLRIGDQLSFFRYQGKDWLLVASQNGSLSLLSVDFTTGSVVEEQANFLGFQDNPANRNLAVAITTKENPDLFTVDQTGRIFLIKDFMNSEVREEVLVKIEDQNLPFRLGRNTWMTVVRQDFSDQVDLILGTKGGGILYLKSTSPGSPNEGEFLVKLFPNPTSGMFKIITNTPAKGRLISSLGQILLDELTIPANREVDIQAQGLNPGLYFLQLETEDRKVLVKKVLVR
jgi:hypothetical protein